MAYIRTEEVREIRNALKEQFPNLKFSLKKQHYSSSKVTIKKGDIDFSDIMRDFVYADINHYHLGQDGSHQHLLEKIDKVITKAPALAEGGREGYDRSDAMTDYFDTAFYYNISIGDYNKPYEKVA